MGQKVNPNIFRLGINKTWKTEFFEKKQQELPLYTFKGLEIKSYIERFLDTQGIFLHDYKQHYGNSTLNIYISYFLSSEFIIDRREKTNKITLVNTSGERKVVTNINDYVKQKSLNLEAYSFRNHFSSNSYIIKNYLNMELKTLNNNFDNVLVKSSVEGALNSLLKVLCLFTHNKLDIVINFCCINRHLSFLKKMQETNIILLQKFKGTSFLREGFELLVYVAHTESSANLLAKFIAYQIKKVKRHKFFLAFLKHSLTVLSNSNSSKVKGIKIMLKGRLNGVPRAKHKTIIIGELPVQSIKAKISFSQTTAHNSNGSYGIKVWIVEKD